MQTHPVPQNVTSYEFRLVGDMTLKQFMFLVVGVVFGFLLYRLPLPFIIRAALAIIPVLGGVLAAFVPIMGRPFVQWISAFFKAIYSPTVFDWALPAPEKVIEPLLSPESVASPKPPILSFGSFFSSIFVKKTAPPLIIPESSIPAPITPPTLQPRITSFSTITEVPKTPAPTPNLPPAVTPTKSEPVTPIVAPSTAPAITNPIKWDASAPSPAPAASLTSSLIAPTTPNILTGLVANTQRQTLFGATVEIIDSKTGIPTRALRTNRLGQFRIAIPLPPGNYHLQTEKEGLVFDPVSITVNNTILQPILIQAK